ncbi:MAG: porphobilinogen synthase [bacterium]
MLRRLRKNRKIINLVSNVFIHPQNFIYPFFIIEGKKIKQEIPSMKGIYRLSIDYVLKEIEKCLELGIGNFILFGVEHRKDEKGSWAYKREGIIPKAIRKIKQTFGDEITLFADVCICQYTNTGHCGIIVDGKVDNSKTLEILSKVALVYAEEGVDFVCPSSMMDLQVKYIRQTLDENNFLNVGIMSYSTKFSSVFYTPFREAADSAPKFGDRSTYQLDYKNANLAILETLKDVEEGADIVMVKPALAYLDIIYQIKQKVLVPVAAYNVSGEYSLIVNSNMDTEKLMLEVLYAIKRAGADIIISYFAKDYAQLYKKLYA